MRRNNFRYYIREGIGSIFTHGFMSFASVFVIIACLLIMGSFALLALNVNSMIKTLESENQILAYIDDNLSDSEAMGLQVAIERVPNVESAYFIDKATALESFKSTYENSAMLEDLEDDILRHRYVIYLTDITLMQQTQQDLMELDGVGSVSIHLEIARGFIIVRNVVSIISLAIVAVLFVISLFIMSNTVKLTTFERREEIAIMKMVGATSSFIRWPFVIEGLILGLLGSLIAFVVQWGLYKLIFDQLIGNTGLSFLQFLPFNTVALPILIVFLVLGFGVGVIGSTTAIKNYLKV